PCIGNVSQDEYRQQVKAACEFLAGQTKEMEQQLEDEMRKAATAQEFEKAAQYRDALADLRKTTQRTTRFERTPWNLPVSLMPDRDNAELGQVLGLSKPPERIEGFDISNISGTLKVASVVSFRNGRPDRANYRRMRIKSVEGQDDFACMAEAVRRRYSRLLREAGWKADEVETEKSAGEVEPPGEEGKAIPQELRTLMNSPQESRELRRNAVKDANDKSKSSPGLPDLIVIDGGKGQLNAACEELAKLDLSGLPIIGLAKEFEEIYRPGAAEPLRLGEDNCALKLLQRIRDESHRVANSYNAQLRLKKISESILDEFPGIGERRKAALLKKFGSIQSLRTATIEEIAKVPGFGGKAASELKTFLEARTTRTN
ncbi:MAG: helix-hairpin-helix domain-containing protein, partial [Verrucomicrobiales bacterium]|nr:helix-hairpin-helix domain-containing protein [Verrucomicrobiales bacterium]